MNKGEKPEPAGGGRPLPPRVLMLSLLVQAPLVIWSWPLEPAWVPALTGAALLACGAALNIWAERLFRRNGVGVCPFSPVPSLVNAGPYRFSRNPMYLGMVLISVSAALITGVYWNLWPAPVLALWLHFRFVLPEEEFLRERLGSAYLTYASRHPRWLGWPGPQTTHAAWK